MCLTVRLYTVYNYLTIPISAAAAAPMEGTSTEKRALLHPCGWAPQLLTGFACGSSSIAKPRTSWDNTVVCCPCGKFGLTTVVYQSQFPNSSVRRSKKETDLATVVYLDQRYPRQAVVVLAISKGG